ncbi:hypothetical protein PDE_07684 [Penicillium oxalicum 114-2]|uniref:Uncharacterized protein n=1 Tax=Penicillium oxalicum (strain 114-2 / CGMCC 5302) TaxID=933388 RepID=S7ZQP0_PENO1|nr:hypothetical protein PDE_07684 [Penicillium oxalicum 114-2]
MDCFKQIFRAIKAPFVRKEGRIVEIGPPTNFRKEELPACFSDAESVLTRNLTPSEPPHLTSQSQYFDVSEKPQRDGGCVSRTDCPSTICVGQDPQPCPKAQRSTLARIRDCLKTSRLSLGPKKTAMGPSGEATGGDQHTFSTIAEKVKNENENMGEQ